MLKKISYFLAFIVSILAGIQGINLIEGIFREANLKVNLKKNVIYEKADDIAKKLNIPKDFKKIAILSEDSIISLYSIYKLKGVDTINYLVDNKIYFPYFWKIRYYKEYDKKEFNVYLSPVGDFLGFNEKLNEEENFNNLSEEVALNSSIQQAKDLFNVELLDYKLIDKGIKKNINGRIDYNFLFEKEMLALENAKLRINLGFSGDKLKAINNISYIPESFIKEYNKIRLMNNVIAYGANFLMVFYITIIFWILLKGFRAKKLATKSSLKVSLFLSFLSSLEYITYLPSLIYERDINQDLLINVINKFTQITKGTVINFVFYFIIFSAADYIDRLAFPDHINLFAILKTKFLASKEFLNLILTGYLLVGVYLFYGGAFYFFTTKYLGWKVFNSGNLSVDVFSKYLAFISTFKDSFFAGVIEEVMFRIIVIAFSMIVLKKWNSKIKLLMVFIIQSLIFGAAHANYPTYPSYFRVIELLFPSLIFGYLYYNFGAIPSILSHWIFDFILMSLPMFKNIKFFGLYQVLAIILIALAPIIIHFIYRFIHGEVKSGYLNSSLFYEKIRFCVEKENLNKMKRESWLFLLAFILMSISYIYSHNIVSEVKKIDITKEDAIERAKEIIKNYSLNDIYIGAIVKENKFTRAYYQKYFESYNNIVNYLAPLKWVVMFRDENLTSHCEIYLGNRGEFLGIKSIIPESIEMNSLSKEEALEKAILKIKEIYKEDNIELVSAKNFILPKRIDWVFIFKIDNIKRVQVYLNGDKVSTIKKKVYISEDDNITINNYMLKKDFIRNILTLVLIIYLVLGFIILSTKSYFNYKKVISIFLYMFALYVFNYYSRFNLELFYFPLGSIKSELRMKSFLLYIITYLRNTSFITFLYLFISNFIDSKKIKVRTLFLTLFGSMIFISVLKIMSSLFGNYIYYESGIYKSLDFSKIYWLSNNFFMTFVISTMILIFSSLIISIMKNNLFMFIFPVLTTLFIINIIPNTLEFSLFTGMVLGIVLAYLYTSIFRFNLNSIIYFVFFTILGLKAIL